MSYMYVHRRGVTCHVVKNIHEHVPPCSIKGVGSGQWYSCLQWNKAILRQKNRVPWLPRIPTVGFLLVFWSNSFSGILGQDLRGPAGWANGFVPMRQCVLAANYVKISKKPLVALQVLKIATGFSSRSLTLTPKSQWKNAWQPDRPTMLGQHAPPPAHSVVQTIFLRSRVSRSTIPYNRQARKACSLP